MHESIDDAMQLSWHTWGSRGKRLGDEDVLGPLSPPPGSGSAAYAPHCHVFPSMRCPKELLTVCDITRQRRKPSRR
jgi:hypothetical protein